MSLEERNCGCNNNSQMQINIMSMQNNSDSEERNPCDCSFNQIREEMIEKIKCYKFAITELALYLDTHPDDEKALCLHNKYCKELKMLEDKYQKVYGPLTITYPCNKWRWLEEPWPWERGNV